VTPAAGFPALTRRRALVGAALALAATATAAVTLLAEPSSPQRADVPNLAFTDSEGRTLELSDLRGKVVLLNVWATWCPPCLEELPSLDRLQAALDDRDDFEVVALSVDRGGIQSVEGFYSEHGIEHLAPYNDAKSRAMRELGVVSIPVTLLIDRDGGEVFRHLGPAEWDSPDIVEKIRATLGEDGALPRTDEA
jgi:thiol-disulfide isomerase/thioredoxin